MATPLSRRRGSPGTRRRTRAAVSVCLAVLAFTTLLTARTTADPASALTPLSLSRAALRLWHLTVHDLPAPPP